jgi:L-methionine (R)-S-oxide reductase
MTLPARQVTPALLQIDAILGRLPGRQAISEVCRYLRGEFPHYRWVGVYRLEEGTLVLEGWDGEQPTEHTRIPLGEGLCGKAARENRTVIVADVRDSPEYLQCFLDTRSEIVVPIRDGSTVLGEIDIDGGEVDAYDVSDDRFLSEVARKLLVPLRAQPAPTGPPIPSATSAASSKALP